MNYYDPPEPEAQGEDYFTCSLEGERKYITPYMTVLLTTLRDGPKIPDPWAATRSPEAVAVLRHRNRERTIEYILLEWKRTEDVIQTCGWEGNVAYVICGGNILWDCPACGEEHDDGPAVDRWGPDPDDDRCGCSPDCDGV
jgi:hypothetical protein